jgi:hypothetical protein
MHVLAFIVPLVLRFAIGKTLGILMRASVNSEAWYLLTLIMSLHMIPTRLML